MEVGRRRQDCSDGVDVALHEVATHAVVQTDRTFEVYAVARL